MRHYLTLCGIATSIIAVSATAPSAFAQEMTATYSCQNIGNAAPEQLGDREGHAIEVNPYSCRIDSGPMSGGVDTGVAIWEWDKTNAVQISASAVERKPGSTLVYQGAGGTLALTMADGKVTGFTASGKGSWPVATGSAAALAVKSATWTAKPTGPGQFSLEVKMQ
jgi:hypothetical protein